MYDQLISWDNLLLAYRKASKGKRGHANVAAFEYRLEENPLALHDELHAQTFSPGGYVSFYTHEPKRRLISAAPFRDRVVHHALCNLIEPIFGRSFVADSYANRAGKGTHRVLARCQQFTRRHPYCASMRHPPILPHHRPRGPVRDPGAQAHRPTGLVAGRSDTTHVKCSGWPTHTRPAKSRWTRSTPAFRAGSTMCVTATRLACTRRFSDHYLYVRPRQRTLTRFA